MSIARTSQTRTALIQGTALKSWRVSGVFTQEVSMTSPVCLGLHLQVVSFARTFPAHLTQLPIAQLGSHCKIHHHQKHDWGCLCRRGLLFLNTTTVQSPFLHHDPLKRHHGLDAGRKWWSGHLFTTDLFILLQTEFLASWCCVKTQ